MSWEAPQITVAQRMSRRLTRTVPKLGDLKLGGVKLWAFTLCVVILGACARPVPPRAPHKATKAATTASEEAKPQRPQTAQAVKGAKPVMTPRSALKTPAAASAKPRAPQAQTAQPAGAAPADAPSPKPSGAAAPSAKGFEDQVAAWASLRHGRTMLVIASRKSEDVMRVTLVNGEGERRYEERLLSRDGQLLLQDAVDLDAVHHRHRAAHSWATCLDDAAVTLALSNTADPAARALQEAAIELLGTYGEPLILRCEAADKRCLDGQPLTWWVAQRSHAGPKAAAWLEAQTSCKRPQL